LNRLEKVTKPSFAPSAQVHAKFPAHNRPPGNAPRLPRLVSKHCCNDGYRDCAVYNSIRPHSQGAGHQGQTCAGCSAYRTRRYFLRADARAAAVWMVCTPGTIRLIYLFVCGRVHRSLISRVAWSSACVPIYRLKRRDRCAVSSFAALVALPAYMLISRTLSCRPIGSASICLRSSSALLISFDCDCRSRANMIRGCFIAKRTCRRSASLK
jgi:hypothetical protein